MNDRLRLEASEDKHAVYPTKQACEDVHLARLMSLTAGLALTSELRGVGEDCGGGGTFIMPIANIGEPDHLPEGCDIAKVFPNATVSNGAAFDDGAVDDPDNPPADCRLGSVFPGQTVWGEEDFAGGFGRAPDSGDPISKSLKGVPEVLVNRLNGIAGPQPTTHAEDIASTVDDAGDAIGSALGTVGGGIVMGAGQILGAAKGFLP